MLLFIHTEIYEIDRLKAGIESTKLEIFASSR